MVADATATASPDAISGADATLLGLVDPGFRFSLPAAGSERAFRLWLAAVAAIYALALLVAALAGRGAEPTPRGQIDGPPSIAVDLVEEPAVDATSKRSQAGQETPAAGPSDSPMQPPSPPAPPVEQPVEKPVEKPAETPAELRPSQPPEAAEPDDQTAAVEPAPAPKEKQPPKPKEPAVPEGIDLSMDRYAAAVDAAMDKARRERATRPQAPPITASIGSMPRITGAAKSGKTDDYSRSVIAALIKTKPKPFAIRGSVMVSFEILPSGALKFVHMLHSSGNTAMDDVAVKAIRSAQFGPPPPTATSSDLTYIIHYVFE